MKAVLGFLLTEDKVVLIQKNRPEWQAGKWNGIGGKIEVGEKPLDAIIREFFEETGVAITHWNEFSRFGYVNQGDNPDIIVTAFYCIATNEELNMVKTMTDEVVQVIEIQDVIDQKVDMLFSTYSLINILRNTIFRENFYFTVNL